MRLNPVIHEDTLLERPRSIYSERQYFAQGGATVTCQTRRVACSGHTNVLLPERWSEPLDRVGAKKRKLLTQMAYVRTCIHRGQRGKVAPKSYVKPEG